MSVNWGNWDTKGPEGAMQELMRMVEIHCAGVFFTLPVKMSPIKEDRPSLNSRVMLKNKGYFKNAFKERSKYDKRRKCM